MQGEYLAYTDKFVSTFKPDINIVENVKEKTKFTSDGIPYVDIPSVIADRSSIKGYGRFIDDNGIDAQVRVEKWPTTFRNVVGGTDGGVMEGDFICKWTNDKVRVVNKAVSNDYPKGWRDACGSIFTQGADYHPDGEQIFIPLDKNPFILIVSKHRHDSTVSPLTFVAIYFDGSRGFAVKPNVYHQAVFPLKDQVHMKSIQGKIHGVVMMDAHREFGVYMRIPNAFQQLSEFSHNHWLHSMHSKFVTILPANDSNINPFGLLIDKFDQSLVEIVPWPSRQRPVWMGNECGVKIHNTLYEYDDNGLLAVENNEVGLFSRNDQKILTNHLSSRPDGSHLIFPCKSSETFIMLFASGTTVEHEEVDPDSVTALLIPCGKGVLIKPNVWYSGPFPLSTSKMMFNEAFSSVNARIEEDLFASFGFIISIIIDQKILSLKI